MVDVQCTPQIIVYQLDATSSTTKIGGSMEQYGAAGSTRGQQGAAGSSREQQQGAAVGSSREQ